MYRRSLVVWPRQVLLILIVGVVCDTPTPVARYKGKTVASAGTLHTGARGPERV